MKKYTFLILVLPILLFLTSCGGGEDCDIRDIEVSIGDCNCEEHYALTLDFIYEDATSDYFTVYARNNKRVGNYKYNNLPVTIDKFELSGKDYDYIKICLDDDPECCEEFEFIPPNCETPVGDCGVFDIEVDVLECLEENKYKLKLNFETVDPGNDFFDLYIRNGELFGYYPIKDLPILIDNFSPSGKDYDYIKVCINDNDDCCIEAEFMPPSCEEDCSISEITVEQGECTSKETYKLHLDFHYDNPTHSKFDIFVRNNEGIGSYPLAELPLTIKDFPISGKDYDFIKICMSDNPDCCKEIEFMSPICEEEECKIFDLEVEAGECLSEETYKLHLDFEYNGPSHTKFEVFLRNNESIGNYPLTDLLLTIKDVELSGKDYEYVKVCMSDDSDCCQEIEFKAPDCENNAECKIKEIEVELGTCTSDSTYNLFIDFEYINPSDENFDVFVRNNEHIGYYPLSDLPLKIEHFQMSGKDYDFIKICINDNPDCCKAIEFMPPDC